MVWCVGILAGDFDERQAVTDSGVLYRKPGVFRPVIMVRGG